MTNKEKEIIDRIKAEKIGKKDKEILEKIEKYGVLKAKNISMLCGYNDVSYARRRLAKMEQGKLVKSEQLGYEKIYMLTGKGKTAINRDTKTFKINSLIFHYLSLGDVAAYLYTRSNVAETQLEADRELKAKFNSNTWHVPDLVIGSTCYEVELNQKSTKDLKKNVRDNKRNYQCQIWFVPDDKQGIRTQLRNIQQELGLSKEQLKIISLDKIEDYIESYFDEVKAGNLPKNTRKAFNESVPSLQVKTTSEKIERIREMSSVSNQRNEEERPQPQQPRSKAQELLAKQNQRNSAEDRFNRHKSFFNEGE